MNRKITKIPITYMDRQRNIRPKGFLPCEVSNRFIQFNLEGELEDYVIADVMTVDKNGKDYKFSELVFKISDILDLASNFK